ncbi:ATP-dependent dethiobiotin synthetase BioD [Pseudonocardiaceae bacterium YIM PH 21723]|nr:ATP-dependent dethiobiotin synthetase BioD [Pseudonocardiaceae bacterium YIM PH 21723]
MGILVVTGTGTEIGKTVVTAALAALALQAKKSVAVLKPVQTGLAAGAPGDLAEVARLTGEDLTLAEIARYPAPLAPNAAARQAGQPPIHPKQVAEAAQELDATHDLVLVESAGGLLVRLDDDGGTVLDVAQQLSAPVLLVTTALLGTLNYTELTTRELGRAGVECQGLVVGSWPRNPGLAAKANLVDLPLVAGAPLLGVIPEGVAKLDAAVFALVAQRSLSPELGGRFDVAQFTEANGT